MQKQFINKKTGQIIFIEESDRDIKEYENSKEWEQVWNLVVE